MGTETTELNASDPKITPKPRLLGISGLRFVAAFLVMLGHFGQFFDIPNVSSRYGGFAVTFFFVLSGFILTYVSLGVLKLELGNIFRFYVKRFARIWPLHLITLLWAVWVIQMGYVSDVFWGNLFLLQSWVPDRDWVFSYNGVSWSISTEIFFSLMLPFFIIGSQRQFWIKYVLLLLSVAGILFYVDYLERTGNIPMGIDVKMLVHVNPLIRLPEFVSGVALCYLYFNVGPRPEKTTTPVADTFWEVTILTLAALVFCYWNDFIVYFQNLSGSSVTLSTWCVFSGPAPIFVAAVWIFSRCNGLISRFLEWSPIHLLGEASYSLFMIHYPIYWCFLEWPWWTTQIPDWILGIVFFAMCCGFSVIVYGLIEQPCRLAIVHASRFNFGKALSTYRDIVGKTLSAKSTWLAGLVSVGGLVILTTFVRPAAEYPEFAEIISSSTEESQDVEFGYNLQLLGCRGTGTARGIEFEMAWKKSAFDAPFHRFTHIIGADKSSLTQLKPVPGPFQDTANRLTIERFEIPGKLLANAQRVSIGFVSENVDSATGKPITLRPRWRESLTGSFRHEIADANLINRLREAHLAAKAKAKQDFWNSLSPIAKEVIESSPAHTRDISFGNSITLLGLKSSSLTDGFLLEFAWHKQEELTHARFTHIIDAQGKMLKQTAATRQPYAEARVGDVFVEKMLIPKRFVNHGKGIAIGFYSTVIDPSTGKPYETLFVDNGPGKEGLYRITIVNSSEFEELVLGIDVAKQRKQTEFLNALPEAAQRIVAKSPNELRNVTFGQKICLLGVSIENATDKVILDFAWQQIKPFTHIRFTHFVGSDGTVLDQTPVSKRLFEAFSEPRVFTERIEIPFRQLDDATAVGIGFYNHQIKSGSRSMHVDRGPRDMRDQRLIVISNDRLNQLRLQRND